MSNPDSPTSPEEELEINRRVMMACSVLGTVPKPHVGTFPQASAQNEDGIPIVNIPITDANFAVAFTGGLSDKDLDELKETWDSGGDNRAEVEAAFRYFCQNLNGGHRRFFPEWLKENLWPYSKANMPITEATWGNLKQWARGIHEIVRHARVIDNEKKVVEWERQRISMNRQRISNLLGVENLMHQPFELYDKKFD